MLRTEADVPFSTEADVPLIPPMFGRDEADR